MIDVVFSQLIEQLNAGVFVLLAILVLFIYACCKITHIITKWNSEHEHYKKSLDVRHQGYDERIKNIEDMRDRLISTQTRVDMIYDLIQRGGVNNSLIGLHRPMALTAIGEEVAKEIKAKEVFEKNVKTLVEKVNQENPQTAYDVQSVSFKVVTDEIPKLLTQEEMNRVKQSAYNRGVSIFHAWIIFGVYLRDRVIQDKGIAPTDLDTPK